MNDKLYTVTLTEREGRAIVLALCAFQGLAKSYALQDAYTVREVLERVLETYNSSLSSGHKDFENDGLMARLEEVLE